MYAQQPAAFDMCHQGDFLTRVGDEHSGFAVSALPQIDRQDSILETVDYQSLSHPITSSDSATVTVVRHI